MYPIREGFFFCRTKDINGTSSNLLFEMTFVQRFNEMREKTRITYR